MFGLSKQIVSSEDVMNRATVLAMEFKTGSITPVLKECECNLKLTMCLCLYLVGAERDIFIRRMAERTLELDEKKPVQH